MKASSRMSRLDKDSRRLARSAVGYAIATALSRIAGLVREALAAGYFGISGAVSAFTIAFQIPNLVRALVADTALEGAIVPVMTEALQREDRRRAVELFSGLVFVLGL